MLSKQCIHFLLFELIEEVLVLRRQLGYIGGLELSGFIESLDLLLEVQGGALLLKGNAHELLLTGEVGSDFCDF